MATITVSELAETLSTDARTARKFLRSITPRDAQPGKGSRWAIEKREVRSLKKKFADFEKAENEKRAARETAKNEAIENENDEVIENEENEPTDEELAAIEND